MFKKRKGFTYDQHLLIARELYFARNLWGTPIGRAYGVSSKAYRLARKLDKAIDALRSELDNRCISETNDPHVYYSSHQSKTTLIELMRAEGILGDLYD